MSAHACNELCSLDDRFHNIQKYEGEYDSWYADKDQMRNFIHKKIEELYELLRKLD